METAAESFKKRAGSATVAGLMRFLKNAPRFPPSRGTKSAEQYHSGCEARAEEFTLRETKKTLTF